ncbi:MAG: AbrB family transcriptional regulator [Pseudomonadota bacterium]
MLADWTAKWRTRLTPRALWRMAVGLVIGAVGGFVAEYFHVPLAWMLGPLFFCLAAVLLRLPAEVPLWMRANFMLLIGLFLGESFEGLAVEQILRWPISMAGAVLYMPVATALTYLYYRHAVREEQMTALCSSIPGGLTAVVLVSESLGADERNVALAQSLRIAFVVCMAPFVAFGLMGFAAPTGDEYEGLALISLPDLALLLAVSLGLVWLLRNTGVPILMMVCPLIASAVLRMAGLVEGVLPHWLVEVGLLVLGASVGCRFAGVEPRRLLRFGTLTFGGTAVLMGVAAVFAFGVAALTGQPLIGLLLAYAPGGVAEMSLIAFAIGADPGFVAVHHLVRIVFVMLMVPMMAVWFAGSADQTARGG